MKLLKLSLAAALTAGALATVASATPLEEAIKNVDLGGSLELKYTNDSQDKTHSHGWKVTGKFNFKTKFDDNFYAVAGLKIDRKNAVDEDKDGKHGNDGTLYLNNAYLGYTNGGTTLIAGRYTLDTFFTNDLFGNGIKLVNTDVEGLTLAALWADNLNKDGDLAVYTKNDVFGLAAIGSYDPVNFQLWYAKYNKVADLYAAELGFDFDAGNNNKINLLAQFASSSLNGDYKKMGYKNGHLYGVKLGFDFSGANFNLGYVNYGTKDDAKSLVSLEDNGQFITAGEQTKNHYQKFVGKNDLWFATVGFNIPDSKFNLGLDYVHNANKMTNVKTNSNEIVARVGYDYSKKLKFSSYYSNYKVKDAKASNEFMFKVKYSF